MLSTQFHKETPKSNLQIVKAINGKYILFHPIRTDDPTILTYKSYRYTQVLFLVMSNYNLHQSRGSNSSLTRNSLGSQGRDGRPQLAPERLRSEKARGPWVDQIQLVPISHNFIDQRTLDSIVAISLPRNSPKLRIWTKQSICHSTGSAGAHGGF